MENKIKMSDEFSEKVELLKNEYPEYKDEIEKSSCIIYINGIPNLNIDEKITDKVLYAKIENIFNSTFNK